MNRETPQSGRKGLLIALSSLLFLILAALLSTPLFLSSSWGTNWILQKVGARAHLTLHVQKGSFSWFGPQKIEGLVIDDSKQKLTARCPLIQTDAGLFALLFRHDLGHLHLSSPHVEMVPYFYHTQASTLFLPPIQVAGFSPSFAFLFPTGKISGKIVVEEGSILLKPEHLDPITFTHLNLSLNLSDRDTCALKLSANTEQERTQGTLALELNSSQMSSAEPEIHCNIDCRKLPLLGVSQLLSLTPLKEIAPWMILLGTSLDVQGNVTMAQGNFSLNLKADSPTLSAQIATQTENQKLFLQEPGTLTIKLFPAVLNPLLHTIPSLNTFLLTQPTSLTCTLSEFSLPALRRAWQKSAFQLALTTSSPLSLQVQNTEVAVGDLSLKMGSSELGKGIGVDGKASFGGTGSLLLSGTLKPLSADADRGRLSLTLSQFPLQLLQPLFPFKTAEMLGDTLYLNGTIALLKDASEIHIALKTPFLSIPTLECLLSDSFTLKTPCPFSYQLQNTLIAQTAVKLQEPIAFQGILQKMQIPLAQIEKSRIDLLLTADKISLDTQVIHDLKTKLLVDSFDDITLQINSDLLDLSAEGSYNPSRREFKLKRPLSTQIRFDNALLQMIPLQTPLLLNSATLQCVIDPMTVNTSFSSEKITGKISLSELEIGVTQLKTPLRFAPMTVPFQWDGKGSSLGLQWQTSVLGTSGNEGTIQGKLILSALLPTLENAELKTSLDFQNIPTSLLELVTGKTGLIPLLGETFSSKCKIQSKKELQNLSIDWTSPLLTCNTLCRIDRNTLQLQGTNQQIQWILTPEGYQTLDQFVTPIAYLEEEQAELLIVKSKKNPPTPKAKAPPPLPFVLKEKSVFSFTLGSLVLPLIPSSTPDTLSARIPHPQFDLAKLKMNLSVKNPSLSFLDKPSQELIQLNALLFSIEKNSDSSPFTLSLDATVITKKDAEQTPKTGALSFKGTLASTKDREGLFALENLTTKASFKMRGFPARILDFLARAHGRTDSPFSALFGGTIDAAIDCDLKDFTGPLQVALHSPNTSASLSGTLTKGSLQLNEPFHAQMKITPEISRLSLKEINPLDIKSFYSQDPVTIEILTHGFNLPLFPFNREQISIPEAKIELGKIFCHNEGNINLALGLLKSSQGSTLNLWFAPLDFHITKGIIDIERTEILLNDSFDIALWGKVDLPKDYVDMQLGLTATTLQKAFGIKDLPDTYVLTFPMRGKMDNVKIDSSKATKKITLLLAWQKADAAGAFAGGPAGALIGGLLNRMATLPDSDAKVPPAKHPFPWEAGKPAKKKKSSDSSGGAKKRLFKQNEKPLKQILKVIR